MKTIRLLIKGKVQGVFFRASAKEIAEQLGIKGEIRNLPDGNVEILATGTDEQLVKLKEWSKKGPPSAVVDEVLEEEQRLQNFPNFRIIRYK